MNETQIKEILTGLINAKFYADYETVAEILDTYLVYDRIGKEVYGELLELARNVYPLFEVQEESQPMPEPTV